MRKLKLQVQVSVDGFIAGPNGEMDWMMMNWDDELVKFVNDFTHTGDCIILGRTLAEGFIPYWTSIVENPQDPQYPFAKIMVDTHKVVFTKTLSASIWANTVLATGDLVDEVNQLKKQNGKDIIVYGGANFLSGLIVHKLIDELNLFINPVALGEGMRIFTGRTNLELLKSTKYSCGINILTYAPVKNSI